MIREFPYTNLHDLNIDWILKIIKEFYEKYSNLDEAFTDMLARIEEKGLQAIADIESNKDSAIDSIRAFMTQCIQEINNVTGNEIAAINTAGNNQQLLISAEGNRVTNQLQAMINSMPANYQDALNQLQIINSVLNMTYNYPSLAQGHYDDPYETDDKTLVLDANHVSSIISAGCASRKLTISITSGTAVITRILWWTGWGDNAVIHRVNLPASTTNYTYTFDSTATYFSIVFAYNSEADTPITPSDFSVEFQWYFEALDPDPEMQTDWIHNKYILLDVDIGQTVNTTLVNSETLDCIILNAQEGDMFTLSGRGGSTARLYGFLDEDDKLISVAAPDERLKNHIIVAPENTAKLIVNSAPSLMSSQFVYKGVYTPSLNTVLANQTENIVLNVSWKRGKVDGNGITTANNDQIITRTLYGINPGEKIVFENLSDDYFLAVYAVKDNRYRLVTKNFLEGRCKIEFTDSTYAYIGRVKRRVTATMDPSEGQNIRISIQSTEPLFEEHPAYPFKKNTGNFGFRRQFTYLNPLLTCLQKDIDINGALVDSTTRCVIELPNHGSVEVKQNTLSGMFKIAKMNNGSLTWLVSDWSYYTYRYIGDNSSTYYCLVAVTPNGTDNLTVDSALTKIAVYSFTDVGVETSDMKSWLNGKTIAVIGDSITQGRFAKFGTSLNYTASKPFGALLAEEAGDMNFGNFGIGGALVSDSQATAWSSLVTNCSKVQGYDIVFVCGGTNDYGNNVSQAEFEADYTTVITTLKDNNTRVIACTPVWRTSKVNANTQGLYLRDYAQMIRDIAESQSIDCIDLYQLTNNGEFIDYCPDGLHPNEIGHCIIANFILKAF